MATIAVEIDEFSNDEIIRHLSNELKSNWLSKEKKLDLKKQIRDCLNIDLYSAKESLSLLDSLKIEFLMDNLDNIKLEDLENLLK